VSYLLDTNVLSEVRRPRPEPRVLAWLDAADEDRLYLSAITIGEIARGVALLVDGRRKQDLAAWLETDLQHRFGPRLLAVDGETALVWGRLMGEARQKGRTVGAMDGWIAATALRHELVLVTRNTKDFENLGVSLFDPWTEISR
jgi:predicted nucleic acid-binding protein